MRLVTIAKPAWQKLFVLLLAAGSIIITVFILSYFKDPKNGILFAIFPVIGGILLLYIFPFFDAWENTLLTTSFFVPLAAYIIDCLKTRRDDRLALEKSVTEVKKKAVEDAVDFHSKLIEELNTHAATFSCKNGVGANPLEDEVWNEGKKKTGMVSDYPGYRLARYYQYTDDFNKYLKALTTKYLFSWDGNPGNDNGRLIEFLKQNFGIDWVKTAKIERKDNNKTIKLSFERKYVLLKLDDVQNEVILEIDDGRTEKFVVKNRIIYDKNFNDFSSKFEDLNTAYKELENILFINLYYNIGSFQYKLNFCIR